MLRPPNCSQSYFLSLIAQLGARSSCQRPPALPGGPFPLILEPLMVNHLDLAGLPLFSHLQAKGK